SDLRGTWDENSFTFSVTAQGIGLKGTLEVEADALKFDGRLPLIAMPFSPWIARVLKKSLEQNVARIDETETRKLAGDNTTDAAYSNTTDTNHGDNGDAPPVVLFLHIPKAGGQTLGEYVYNQCRRGEAREDDLLNAGVAYLTYGFLKEPELALPEHVRPLLQRRDLRAVIGHFWFGLHEHVARPSTYITLLRHPLERVVSLYYYAKLSETMSLEEFVRSPPFKEVDNDQTRRLAGVDPEIGACTHETLRAAKENLRRHFSVVGTVERFDETLVLLKRRLGWTREIISYPRNVNAARQPTASLSPEVLAAVLKRNELDFELWQYAAQLLDEAIAGEGAEFYAELERYNSLRAASPEANAPPS
ncbi:MAG TPA: sulfotransferase family 2 domain-containing protein, partial [Pyrinomonadaceae bacterium]|nr:sulfotransferase family 2 domain-containing protein [Pyrinomonadaceae bacterium]